MQNLFLPLRTDRRTDESPFMKMPYDVRRIIYNQVGCLPVGKVIHLTLGPSIEYPEDSKPSLAKYHISKHLKQLMLVCRDVRAEVADIIYGTNTFVLTRGGINYNNDIFPYPQSNQASWLYYMRPSTRERVKLLELYLDCPRDELIDSLVHGIAGFPRVKITLASLGNVDGEAWVRRRSTYKMLLEAIALSRSGYGASNTVWDDARDLEIAYLYCEALPHGFETAGLTAIERLDSEDAWY